MRRFVTFVKHRPDNNADHWNYWVLKREHQFDDNRENGIQQMRELAPDVLDYLDRLQKECESVTIGCHAAYDGWLNRSTMVFGHGRKPVNCKNQAIVNLRPGDVLKLSIWYKQPDAMHEGMYVGSGRVVDLVNVGGTAYIRLVPMWVFLRRRPSKILLFRKQTAKAGFDSARRALKDVGTKLDYSLMFMNCCHAISKWKDTPDMRTIKPSHAFWIEIVFFIMMYFVLVLILVLS
jgi:hypothetical protein